MNRPKLVAAAGVLLIIQLLGAFLGMSRQFSMAEPDRLHQAFGITNFFVILVVTIFVWRGKWWARAGYTAWGLIALSYALVITHFQPQVLVSAVPYLVIVTFLFLPRSNEYFRKR